MALATHILISDHIPEAHTHIEPTIGQSRHTASHERIGTTLPPGGYFGAGVFIQYDTTRINIAKLTATLKIRRDNSRDLLGRHIVTTKCCNGNRHLGHTHARHFHTKLRMGTKADQCKENW